MTLVDFLAYQDQRSDTQKHAQDVDDNNDGNSNKDDDDKDEDGNSNYGNDDNIDNVNGNNDDDDRTKSFRLLKYKSFVQKPKSFQFIFVLCILRK